MVPPVIGIRLRPLTDSHETARCGSTQRQPRWLPHKAAKMAALQGSPRLLLGAQSRSRSRPRSRSRSRLRSARRPATMPPRRSGRRRVLRLHSRGGRHAQRNRPHPGARQRAGPRLRPGLAPEGLAQGQDRRDADPGDRDPAGHRRQGGAHRQHGGGGVPARPPARARPLSHGGREGGRAGDQGLAEGLGRVVGDAVGAPRRSPAQGGRAARRALARHRQRGVHAQPVEDRLPGRDRLGVRAHRLLPFQPPLHALHLRAAAGEHARPLGLCRVPCARGLRLRGHPLQLHLDRRQPADRRRR